MQLDNQDTKLCSEFVFKTIFEENFKLLRNFLAFKFRGDINTAEDLAQNAFVKLWENCKILKPEQAKSFLFTTAIRLSLNTIKHEKVVLNYELKFDKKKSHTETPEFLIEESELKLRLEKAISELPENQRIVFLMNRFEKQTYNEIANILDISVKTVEKRMHDALFSLRKIVKNI